MGPHMLLSLMYIAVWPSFEKKLKNVVRQTQSREKKHPKCLKLMEGSYYQIVHSG